MLYKTQAWEYIYVQNKTGELYLLVGMQNYAHYHHDEREEVIEYHLKCYNTSGKYIYTFDMSGFMIYKSKASESQTTP